MVRQAHGPEQSRRTHHPEQIEGQIPINEIQNSKLRLNASMAVLDIGELGF
jgi:hypothetical protein